VGCAPTNLDLAGPGEPVEVPPDTARRRIEALRSRAMDCGDSSFNQSLLRRLQAMAAS
jgi:hypothetical protein